MYDRLPRYVNTEISVSSFCKQNPFLFSVTLVLIIIVARQLYNLTLGDRAYSGASHVRVVLLLAYPRSGSTLTGEILSLSYKSSYFFEPMHYYTKIGKDQSSGPQIFLLRSLTECDGDVITVVHLESSMNIVRALNGKQIEPHCGKGAEELQRICQKSSVRIFKTIHVKMPVATDFLSTLESIPNVESAKIIHLVRDPRAMIASQRKASILWLKQNTTPREICDLLKANLLSGSTLSPSKYYLLRYEDLVTSPLTIAKELFEFLEIPEPTSRLKTYIDSHMNAEMYPPRPQDNSRYTIRNSSFNPEHWKNEETTSFVLEVETACKWVLNELGYKRLDLDLESQNDKSQPEDS